MARIHQIFFILAMMAAVLVNVAYLWQQSIRLDEAQSIWVSTKSVASILLINGQDVQTPLYALILHFWLQRWGTGIAIARLLSLVFFLATLPFIYFLIKEAGDMRTAYLGTTLFSLSPFLMWFSQEARTYTLLSLLAAANHYFFLRFIRSKGHTNKLGVFITAVLGIYTHYFFIFLLAAQTLFLGYYWIRTRRTRQFGIFMSLMVAVAEVFMPWAWYVYHLGLASNTQPLIPTPTSYNLLQVYVNFILGFQNQTLQSLSVAMWPLFLMVLFFVFTRKFRVKLQRLDYFLWVSVIPVVLIYAVSYFKPIFLPRYLIFITPTLFALLAWMLNNATAQFLSGATLSFMILMLISLNFQDMSLQTPVKEDYKQVVNYLEVHTTPHDIIAVSAPFTVYPIEYYYAGLPRIDTIPHWNRYTEGPIPAFQSAKLAKQIDTYRSIYNRLYVVLSYDQGYQGEISQYLDHHLERLSDMNFPSSIEVRVYQLRYDVPLMSFKKS